MWPKYTACCNRCNQQRCARYLYDRCLGSWPSSGTPILEGRVTSTMRQGFHCCQPSAITVTCLNRGAAVGDGIHDPHLQNREYGHCSGQPRLGTTCRCRVCPRVHQHQHPCTSCWRSPDKGPYTGFCQWHHLHWRHSVLHHNVSFPGHLSLSTDGLVLLIHGQATNPDERSLGRHRHPPDIVHMHAGVPTNPGRRTGCH